MLTTNNDNRGAAPMRGQERGFTLIELVVVITILGILAAVALPKFVDVQSDARKASLDGIASSVHGAASLVYAKAMIDGVETDATGTVAVQGGNVDIEYGYPSDDTAGAGIHAALQLDGEIDVTTAGVFKLRDNCLVTYTAPTSSVGANAAYSLVKTDTGC